MRTCRKCRLDKPEDAFPFDKRGWTVTECFSCKNIRQREAARANYQPRPRKPKLHCAAQPKAQVPRPESQGRKVLPIIAKIVRHGGSYAVAGKAIGKSRHAVSGIVYRNRRAFEAELAR